MCWRKVSLIGVGLLGGSLGMALRTRGLAKEVHGFVRRAASIEECLRAGAVDAAGTDLAESVRNADLVVFCTPLAQMKELALRAEVAPGCVVTDVGSVKGELAASLEPVFKARGAVFIGSHPMAGSEKTGVLAGRPDLFQGAVCVVTPAASSPPEILEKIEALWRGVGARVLRLTPEKHDELVSRSSHLPHVLAAQLAAYVLEARHGPEQGELCATGFRDSSRIASGSPEMWRDIALMNRAELKKALREFTGRLAGFEALLDRGRPEEVQEFFEKAKSLRDGWRARFDAPSGE